MPFRHKVTTRLCAAFLALLPLSLPGLSAAGEVDETDGNIDGALSAEGWEHLLFEEGDTPVRFERTGTDGIALDARNAVSFLYKPLKEKASTSMASWQWRVTRHIPATDLSRLEGDDRAVAVHFLFKEDGFSLGGWLKKTFGYPAFDYVLSYVWGGTQAPGTMLDNPHLENAAVFVLRNGADMSAEWHRENVDLAADFRRAFGRDLPAARYVALSADTEDTMTEALAEVAGLSFTGGDAGLSMIGSR